MVPSVELRFCHLHSQQTAASPILYVCVCAQAVCCTPSWGSSWTWRASCCMPAWACSWPPTLVHPLRQPAMCTGLHCRQRVLLQGGLPACCNAVHAVKLQGCMVEACACAILSWVTRGIAAIAHLSRPETSERGVADMPYLSCSFSDFWSRRWNLTCSSALRFLTYDPIVEGVSLAL